MAAREAQKMGTLLGAAQKQAKKVKPETHGGVVWMREGIRAGALMWGGGEEDDAGKCGTGDGVRRCGREGGLKHCEGQAVGGGGWRGRAPEGTRMRGGSSDRPSTAGEAGRVSKRRQESLEKHAGGTKLGARDGDKEGKTRWGQAAGE